jgi:hypothetical protein
LPEVQNIMIKKAKYKKSENRFILNVSSVLKYFTLKLTSVTKKLEMHVSQICNNVSRSECVELLLCLELMAECVTRNHTLQ